MPKFTLPKPSKKVQKTEEAITALDEYYPHTVHLPANSLIIKSLSVGDNVEVKLVGKVEMLEERKSKRKDRAEFSITLESVEAYGSQSLDSLTEDDDA